MSGGRTAGVKGALLGGEGLPQPLLAARQPSEACPRAALAPSLWAVPWPGPCRVLGVCTGTGPRAGLTERWPLRGGHRGRGQKCSLGQTSEHTPAPPPRGHLQKELAFSGPQVLHPPNWLCIRSGKRHSHSRSSKPGHGRWPSPRWRPGSITANSGQVLPQAACSQGAARRTCTWAGLAGTASPFNTSSRLRPRCPVRIRSRDI